MTMPNPNFGVWGHPDDWGDTARRSPRRYGLTRPLSPTSVSANHCPHCGAFVRWDLNPSGNTVATVNGLVHVCDTSRALAYLDHRPGAEILGLLRHVINERRMYGEAV